ncbi:hypothetical protein Tco_0235360, partial [Tanacetum coccineum]
MDNMLLLYDLLLHVECDIGVIVYSCRQHLGFIPSGDIGVIVYSCRQDLGFIPSGDISVIVYSCRQDLGFIPSGNVVLSSTYVGKILGADQLLVILCYRYQESGIGYWILSMTISGSR